MHFAAIGTREPAPAQLEQLYRWLGGLSRTRDNAVLHTGAAPGVDQLAALRWLQDGGDVHLHLPWPAYERTWVENIVREYGGRRCVVDRPAEPAEDALRLAALHHPRWETLGRGPRSLHARNVEIVRPVTLGVIALPGTSRWGGGTAMGMKLALHHGLTLRVCDPLGRPWDSCGCPRTDKRDEATPW